MKMKKLLVTLLALGLYSQQAPAQTGSHFSSTSATRSLSDEGDYNRYAVAETQNAVDMSMIAPTAYGEDMGCSSCGTGDSGSYFDYGSCNVSGCGGSPSTWFTAETLLVFAANRQSPVLVTTADNGVFPIQGATGVTNQFGGTIGSDLLPGYRLSAGKYFGCDKKFGIGARGYGIYDGSESYSLSSNGDTSIGIPFFNLSAGSANQQVVPGQTGAVEDAYIVAGRTPALDLIATGSVSAKESLQMVGGELSAYLLVARNGSFRTDLVAGYTYNQLRNKISLDTTSTNEYTGDAIANGTVLTTSDRFAADNVFHGAHLGLLSSVVRKRVNLSTLAKISFGNMRSKVNIAGSNTVDGTPGSGGIFALDSNIGSYTTDSFAFLPEVGFKLGYSVRPNVQFTVGYTLLLWSDVMLAGNQIDRTLVLTGLGPRPAQMNAHSAYYMQSIDLGLSLAY